MVEGQFFVDQKSLTDQQAQHDEALLQLDETIEALIRQFLG